MAAMAEVQRRALEEAFGASSSSDDDGEVGYGDGDDHRTLGRERKLAEMIPVWESTCEVNGLWLCREFLSENEQHWILSSIHQGFRSFKSLSLISANPISRNFFWISILLFVLAEGWFNGGSFNQVSSSSSLFVFL